MRVSVNCMLGHLSRFATYSSWCLVVTVKLPGNWQRIQKVTVPSQEIVNQEIVITTTHLSFTLNKQDKNMLFSEL